MLTLHFLTEFPQELNQFLIKGIFKRAFEEKKFNVKFHLIRDFAIGKHKKIDDYPYSKKKGMLIRADVLSNALNSIPDITNKIIICGTPQGKKFTQHSSETLLAQEKDIVFVSGYYEGIDARLFKLFPIQCISVGDYILNSGDSASIVMAETMIRQIPGVLGNIDCVSDDTFSTPFLEPSQYTHPQDVYGQTVPDMLRSGNHNAIDAFKVKESIEKTLFNRIDLVSNHLFDSKQKKHMTDIINTMVVKHK